MKIVLCVEKQDAEYLKQRIAFDESVGCTIDMFHDSQELLKAKTLDSCQVVWIALDGAAGMETVIALKERFPLLPIVWMSEDKFFAATAYNLKVAYFLHKNCTADEIAKALKEVDTERRGSYAYRVML